MLGSLNTCESIALYDDVIIVDWSVWLVNKLLMSVQVYSNLLWTVLAKPNCFHQSYSQYQTFIVLIRVWFKSKSNVGNALPGLVNV